MAPTRSKKERRKQWRNVGYVLVVLLYLGWFQYDWQPIVLGVLSILLILYGLFAAPIPCGAITRKNLRCRHNASGLLRGCDIEQHKWQHVRMLVDRESWREYRRAVLSSLAGNAAAFGVVTGSISAMAAVVMPLVTKFG